MAIRLASIHNITYYTDLMKRASEAIKNGNFSNFKCETLKKIESPDQPA
ncbi:MAG: hypothetical protein ACLFQK_04790 [Fibrobacterota bacterium]